jgi:hypothetical protein
VAVALPDDPAAIVAAADDPTQAILVLVDRARAWLVEATHVEDVVDVKAKAAAIHAYTVQARLGAEAQAAALQIQRRAERRAGELVAEANLQPHRPKKASSATTLPDLGITRDESAEFQKLAAIPEHEFDDIIDRLKAGEVVDERGRAKTLSRAAILDEARKRKAEADDHREWFNGMAASLTPEQKAEGKRRGAVMAAISEVADAVQRLDKTASPEEVADVLNTTLDHVGKPLRTALTTASTTIRNYAKAVR